MPELPEVETSRRGIEPFLVGEQIRDVVIRQRRLRWPIRTRTSTNTFRAQPYRSVGRRAKYLLINTSSGTAILHLGMSGSVDNCRRRYASRRFMTMSILCLRPASRFAFATRGDSARCTGRQDAKQHWLLNKLGPEPLDEEFAAEYSVELAHAAAESAVKQFIMNANVVVGVGNIYASESLFLAGIHPRRAAGRIAQAGTKCSRRQ